MKTTTFIGSAVLLLTAGAIAASLLGNYLVATPCAVAAVLLFIATSEIWDKKL